MASTGELDGAPFGAAREVAGRLVGCCRDFTVLFVSLARAAGIPARALPISCLVTTSTTLDKVAAITGPGHSRLQEVQDIYERHPELQVPAVVTSYDPMGGPPREVLLGQEVTH